MRTIAEGKRQYALRIKEWVIDRIQAEEVDTGLYDTVPDFIQSFMRRFLAGETLQRNPVLRPMKNNKVSKSWHLDSELLDKLNALIYEQLGQYRNVRDWLDKTLTRYYLGYEIKLNQ